VDELRYRAALGSTAKTPRWAAAFKYPPEEKLSLVKDIVIQVGRTGVLTPKAVIEPVRLAGTTVTNASLHNSDYIAQMDVRVGDTVMVRKAGEIIPEIVRVLFEKRPEDAKPFVFPNKCPSCGAAVERDADGAAVRCINPACPVQRLRNIVHFASRDAMDIEGMGIANVEQFISEGLIEDVADIYYIDAGRLTSLERKGEKSAGNLMASIERSKDLAVSSGFFMLLVFVKWGKRPQKPLQPVSHYRCAHGCGCSDFDRCEGHRRSYGAKHCQLVFSARYRSAYFKAPRGRRIHGRRHTAAREQSGRQNICADRNFGRHYQSGSRSAD
jgi:NAD-dependent DNA ligase